MEPKYKLSDWEPGAKYAAGTTPSGKWRWKDVDQKYVDKLNAAWDAVTNPRKIPAEKPKKGKPNAKAKSTK